MNYGSAGQQRGNFAHLGRFYSVPTIYMMPTITPPASTAVLLDLLKGSGIIPAASLEERLAELSDLPPEPMRAAELLIRQGILTPFQAKQLLAGRHRGFRLGSYVIQDMLGQGGMGSVYLAEHSTLRRRVALKVLRQQKGPDAKVSVERFLREARAAAALDHPNIVRIHDVAQQGDVHFLAMEYVEGQTLDQILSRGGAIAPSRAVGYIAQAAAGLQHAHEKGFVHRDIKPANLMLGNDGTVKILDMGLARSLTSDGDNLTEMLDKGAVVGTADYISPEQALGDANVDIRADIYSLGATFFALVTGKPPFRGSTSQKLAQHQMKPAPDLTAQDRTFPPELAMVIAKMLAKKPKERYETPADLIAALAPWLSDDHEHKVVAGLSGIDEGSSGRLRETLVNVRAKQSAASDSTMTTKKSKTARLLAQVDEPEEPEEADTSKKKQKRMLMIGGAAAAGLLLISLVAYAAWPSSQKTETAQNTPVNPTPQPNPQPPSPKPNPTPPGPKPNPNPNPPPQTGNSKVAITEASGAYYIKTPKYDAMIDKADGNLCSFRVGGTEFLRTGAPVGKEGRTNASGAYFMYEKAGHHGAVKMTDISRPSPTSLQASGGSFTVRYDFDPNSLKITAQNATDDSVPYFLLFDSEYVNDVANEKGEKFSLPWLKPASDPVDPVWRVTTWYAGRASVKVTDLTEKASTRIWGPFSPFQSQVWHSNARTYNQVQLTLEPSIATDASPTGAPGGVLVSRNGSMRQIRTEHYEATVDKNGWISSLRIDGVEVLKSNIGAARGLYFNGVNPPSLEVKQSGTSVEAQSEKAYLRYNFAHNKITITLENRMDKACQFYASFDTSVTAVQNEKNEWAKLPITKSVSQAGLEGWKNTTFYAGRVKLKLTNANRIWGPWDVTHHQVWEANLAAGEKRTVTLEIGLTDAAEAEKIKELTGEKPVPTSGLTVDSPLNYQVFQRRSKTEGAMKIRGRSRSDIDKMEAKISGKPLQGSLPDQWKEVSLTEKGKMFEGMISAPAGGWYKVEIRALKGGKVVAQSTVEHVGVGEVFINAGQSNSTNCGQFKTKQKSDMVSAFSGINWQLANDPQPGCHDNSGGGSPWPAFGDAMYEEYQVPIGIATTGHSGTSVNQWAPGSELCRWTITRIRQLGPRGFRAVLWHQGESDVGMPVDEYVKKMTALIRETQKYAAWEVPWFVAQVSYHNPTQISFPNVRAAQKKLWDTSIAYEGPDTDTLTGDHRDQDGKGIHFSPKGLQAHGKMWAQKVAVYLDKELGR